MCFVFLSIILYIMKYRLSFRFFRGYLLIFMTHSVLWKVRITYLILLNDVMNIAISGVRSKCDLDVKAKH